MRVSKMLTTTLREAPRDAEGGNQELLLRAGFARQLTMGVYSFLPLGDRVIRKISQIVREEMDRAGGQEVTMPVLQPRDMWEVQPPSGPTRVEGFGGELFSLKDRKGRDMVLGPTHEEVVTTLVAEFVRSYRDLPQLIYQIQVKFRDQFRSRGGLLRTREFLMKDLYSFDADAEGMDESYRKMSAAYSAALKRCGLRFVVIHADSGAIGGKESQEFIALTEAGEDEAMICNNCDYAANREKAEFVRTEQPIEPEAELEEVHTPGIKSIEDLTAFLSVPAAKTLKTVSYVAGGKFILAVVRGDLDVNEIKLSNTLYRNGIKAADLHLATLEEMTGAGMVAGFMSPLHQSEEVLVIADTSVKLGNNFVVGANRLDYHVKNANLGRDFQVDTWEDVASAYEGATCVRCGGQLHTERGSEVGHIFKLGSRYSEMFNATFLDESGAVKPCLMGCYGMGISRLMATIVEQSHDEKGIIWPISVAPYQVTLLGLDMAKSDAGSIAEKLYQDLTAAGIEVLFDDRSESVGVKFNDADLIGIPLRLVVSKRSLKNGGVEMKMRTQKESQIVPLEEVLERVVSEVRQAMPVAN